MARFSLFNCINTKRDYLSTSAMDDSINRFSFCTRIYVPIIRTVWLYFVFVIS